MDHLDYLENKSIYTIREAYAQHPISALLWSIGKDSTALLWLCRKAFLGKLPFPVLHIDTSYKFKEMYEQRDRLVKKWGLNLLVAKNEEALEKGMSPEKEGRLNCCTALKTKALQNTIKEKGFDAIFLGIRRDEHGIRAKERVFSPRNDDFQWDYKNQPMEVWEQYGKGREEDHHIRIHPLLDWTELDIWLYTRREKLPSVKLYYAKQKKRFRSIGCERCCSPVESSAQNIDQIIKEIRETNISERAGRAQDKESAFMMQKLRSLGYM
ncbi:sulfate adenylyltransferase [bacterium F11]|nr:sulfate adenylyltransferase [bacterium F11]